MSVYQRFSTITAALEAFAAGACRRHVEIDGHVIDLVQAMAEQGRVREEPTGELVGELSLMWSTPTGRLVQITVPPSREDHDRAVAANVAAWLHGGADAVKVVRGEPGPMCPCCLRPEVLP